MPAGIKSEQWPGSNRNPHYGAQNGHGDQRQVCLAYLLRDAQYAIDHGDKVFAPGFKALLKRACTIGKRRATDETGSRIRPWSNIWPGWSRR